MEQKIKQLVNDLELGALEHFSWLGNGFSSHAYEIKTSVGTYVLLESKKDSVEPTNYKNYYANLRCLEKKKYRHAPRAVYVSDDGRKILITKVSGTVVTDLKDLAEATRKTIAMNITHSLLELQAVRPQDLAAELRAVGLKLPKPHNEEKDWDTYVIKTFYPYTDAAPSDAQTEWLEAQITAHTPIHNNGKEVMFHHGDTSGPNILIDKNFQVMLIDWGGAQFYASSKQQEDYGLAYTFNHVPLMTEFQDEILQYVAQAQSINYDGLKKHIFAKQKDIKIADIAWAYMMYTKATAGKTPEKPEVFKKILDQRIKEYKKIFS